MFAVDSSSTSLCTYSAKIDRHNAQVQRFQLPGLPTCTDELRRINPLLCATWANLYAPRVIQRGGRRRSNSISVGSGNQPSKWIILSASCQRYLPGDAPFPSLDAKHAEPSRFLAVILGDFHPPPSTIKPPWRQRYRSQLYLSFSIYYRSSTWPVVKHLDRLLLPLASLYPRVYTKSDLHFHRSIHSYF